MEPITDEFKVFLHNKRNTNTMCVGDTILATEAEDGIDENCFCINNKSIWNDFTNGKYMSKISDAPDGQYLNVPWNAGVTYTNNIGEITGY